MNQPQQPAIPRLRDAFYEFIISQCGGVTPTIDIVAAPAQLGDPELTVTGRMHFQISGYVDVANFNIAQGFVDRLASNHSEAA